MKNINFLFYFLLLSVLVQTSCFRKRNSYSDNGNFRYLNTDIVIADSLIIPAQDREELMLPDSLEKQVTINLFKYPIKQDTTEGIVIYVKPDSNSDQAILGTKIIVEADYGFRVDTYYDIDSSNMIIYIDQSYYVKTFNRILRSTITTNVTHDFIKFIPRH